LLQHNEAEEQAAKTQAKGQEQSKKTDQTMMLYGNQEIPLDTSAFIRHYNEFL